MTNVREILEAFRLMDLHELGERRANFIKECRAMGMGQDEATSEDNWRRFKHYCETGELLDAKDPKRPQAVRSTGGSSYQAAH